MSTLNCSQNASQQSYFVVPNVAKDTHVLLHHALPMAQLLTSKLDTASWDTSALQKSIDTSLKWLQSRAEKGPGSEQSLPQL